jgi:hypothetical protein
MCGLDGKQPPAQLNSVDYLFELGVEQEGFDYGTSAEEAGSDHRPEELHGTIPAHTIPLDIQEQIKNLELKGASN